VPARSRHRGSVESPRSPRLPSRTGRWLSGDGLCGRAVGGGSSQSWVLGGPYSPAVRGNPSGTRAGCSGSEARRRRKLPAADVPRPPRDPRPFPWFWSRCETVVLASPVRFCRPESFGNRDGALRGAARGAAVAVWKSCGFPAPELRTEPWFKGPQFLVSAFSWKWLGLRSGSDLSFLVQAGLFFQAFKALVCKTDFSF